MINQQFPHGVRKLRDIPDSEKAVYQFESRITGRRNRSRFTLYPSMVGKAFKSWELKLLARKNEAKSPRFFEILDQYLETHVRIRKSPGAYKLERHAVALYKQLMTNRPVSEIRRADIDHLIARLVETRRSLSGSGQIKPASVNRLLAPLSSFFTWVKRLDLYDRENPVWGTNLPMDNTRRVRLSFPEIEAMMNRAEMFDMGLYAYMVLAVYAGFRRGEILKLRWSDFDLEQRLIFLKSEITKTKSARAYKMPPSVYEFIIAWKSRSRTDLYLTLERNGLRYRWVRFRDRYEYRIEDGRPMTLHDLRHISGQLVYEIMGSIDMARDHLGHRSSSMTLSRYVHHGLELDRMAEEVENVIPLKRKAN